jgi:hypothetical protein
MPAPRPWIVTPHRPLEQLEDNLWCIESDVPGLTGLNRRMTILRRQDGTLLFYNAVPVDESTLSTIHGLGKPAVLVIPHTHHALDAQAFRDKLNVRVFAPGAYRAEVAQRVTVDDVIEALPKDPSLELSLLPGLKSGETVGQVRSGDRVSLLFADVVTFVRTMPGWRRFLFRAIGFTGEHARMPLPVQLRFLRDRKALRGRLLELANLPGLVRIVTSHGERVEQSPAPTLRSIATRL